MVAKNKIDRDKIFNEHASVLKETDWDDDQNTKSHIFNTLKLTNDATLKAKYNKALRTNAQIQNAISLTTLKWVDRSNVQWEKDTKPLEFLALELSKISEFWDKLTEQDRYFLWLLLVNSRIYASLDDSLIKMIQDFTKESEKSDSLKAFKKAENLESLHKKYFTDIEKNFIDKYEDREKEKEEKWEKEKEEKERKEKEEKERQEKEEKLNILKWEEGIVSKSLKDLSSRYLLSDSTIQEGNTLTAEIENIFLNQDSLSIADVKSKLDKLQKFKAKLKKESEQQLKLKQEVQLSITWIDTQTIKMYDDWFIIDHQRDTLIWATKEISDYTNNNYIEKTNKKILSIKLWWHNTKNVFDWLKQIKKTQQEYIKLYNKQTKEKNKKEVVNLKHELDKKSIEDLAKLSLAFSKKIATAKWEAKEGFRANKKKYNDLVYSLKRKSKTELVTQILEKEKTLNNLKYKVKESIWNNKERFDKKKIDLEINLAEKKVELSQKFEEIKTSVKISKEENKRSFDNFVNEIKTDIVSKVWEIELKYKTKLEELRWKWSLTLEEKEQEYKELKIKVAKDWEDFSDNLNRKLEEKKTATKEKAEDYKSALSDLWFKIDKKLTELRWEREEWLESTKYRVKEGIWENKEKIDNLKTDLKKKSTEELSELVLKMTKQYEELKLSWKSKVEKSKVNYILLTYDLSSKSKEELADIVLEQKKKIEKAKAGMKVDFYNFLWNKFQKKQDDNKWEGDL